MDILNNFIYFLMGATIGFGVHHVFSNQRKKTKTLEKILDETQAELTRYKNEVDLHFQKTAQLLHGFGNQYQQIHQHLSKGAQQLSHHPMPTQVNQATEALPSSQSLKTAQTNHTQMPQELDQPKQALASKQQSSTEPAEA